MRYTAFRRRAGEAVRVTSLNSARHETAHGWPHFLSDELRFVYVVHTTAEQRNEIHVASLAGGLSKLLVKADSLVGFNPPWLLYVKETTLYAQRLDERNLALQGDPVEIAGNVGFSEVWASAGASVSPNGTIASLSGLSDPERPPNL